jgi:hypothetical protein
MIVEKRKDHMHICVSEEQRQIIIVIGHKRFYHQEKIAQF